MDTRANVFLRHQQQRWLRADAARWVRPDAAKFLKPGTPLADIYPALAFKYNPDQPRVPAGNSRDSGRWGDGGSSGRPRVYITGQNDDGETLGDGGTGVSLPSLSFDVGDLLGNIDWSDLFDVKPRKRRTGGVRLAGDLPDGFGAPDDKPPKVPAKRPKKSSQRTGVFRVITSWARRHPAIAGDLIAGLLDISDWMDAYEDLIEADRDPPKTMQDLQAGVGQRRPGYDTHHIIEQTAAEKWELTRSEIDDPSNLVSIPRLRHYQITGWYGTRTDRFGGLSPREYLSDKGPDERRRIGLEALVRFEVLKP